MSAPSHPAGSAPSHPAGSAPSHPAGATETSRQTGELPVRVGMVGGGQLARMTHRAAIDLGVSLEVLTPGSDDPAAAAGARFHAGQPDDLDALAAFGATVDVVTLDHELVSADGLQRILDAGGTVHPSPRALRFAQDKLHARTGFRDAGFPVPPFRAIDTSDAVASFADVHGWPVVLKAQAGGYDGRGVEVVADVDTATSVLTRPGDWMIEAHVPIATEVAVVLARSPDGATVVYPVVETVQRDGICVELVLPARIPDALAHRAKDLATRIADTIGVVGILAVELFVTTDDHLVVNEIATRPHNSGHATIEGSVTSQFTNHLRAVLGWPLGAVEMRAPVAVTVNLLGGPEPVDPRSRLPLALQDPHVHAHLYGKLWRPGRKLGHVTVLGDDVDAALASARLAAARLTEPDPPGARP